MLKHRFLVFSLCGVALGRWWPDWGNGGLTTTNDVAITTASTINSDEKFVGPFNRALSFIDSVSDYIQPISNIIFGFMLIKMFVIDNESGCKLPTGLRVQNGWRKLSTNCQEECFCIKNEFNCRSKACDLNANQCVLDAFGDNFCYPINKSGSVGTNCEADTTITPNSTITPETTEMPSTTINLHTTSTASTTTIPTTTATTTTTSIISSTAPLSGCDSSSISDSQYCFTIPDSYEYYDYYFDHDENNFHGIDEITVGATITMSKTCAPDYQRPGLNNVHEDLGCDYFHRENYCNDLNVDEAILIASHTNNGYITPLNCPQCGCTEDDIITLNEIKSGTRSNSGGFAALRAMLKESRNI